MADSNVCLVAINVGAYGEEGNSTVFRDSPLGKTLNSGNLNLTPLRCLPNNHEDPQPYVFVSDETFRIPTNILRPYPARELNASN
ncbi:hypothetical protein PR048_001748 [Dryococelus australis]|uniref:Uncharacterized protein n=1 Tax=Dryococelus australis TaxID=614101 RepID=A0ABQ9II60_9NEOP|nr:hypothetical protein PR048_001748 [Dryococelus australis]